MWRALPTLRCTRPSLARMRFASSLSRFHIDEQVQEALNNQEPVVALESTIVAHGMPFPQNLELVNQVETILLSKGVTPATIAVKDGVCHVGLTSEELHDLAISGNEGRATKCSTRDLPVVMATQHKNNKTHTHQWGATTVASTMVLADMVGISTFVTGGIGGVHRNGQITMDISADLTELSRTPVVVVSAGIKSILDIGRTLEMLETLGVPALAFGTDEFPAFFSPDSGVEAPSRVDDASDVAGAYWACRELKLPCGMLVAVPNNDPAGANVERAIQDALVKAEQRGIHGRDVTPFVLKEVAEQTGGDSLRSNMALVRQNAAVGADIAIAIAKEAHSHNIVVPPATVASPPVSEKNLPRSRVIVMGGAVVDLVARPNGEELVLGTSNPGVCSESDGGVGRNIAEVLGLLGNAPLLFSAVGNDSRGQELLNRLKKHGHIEGVDHSIQVVDRASTATYIAVIGGTGEMHTAVADMSVFDEIMPPPVDVLSSAEILVLDANPSVNALTKAAQVAVDHGVVVFFEPTSVEKACQVARNKELLSYLTYAFPNVDELMGMTNGWTATEQDRADASRGDFELVKLAAAEVLRHMRPDEAHVLVTMGKDGVLLASRDGPSAFPQFVHFPAEEGVEIENCTGAGDTLCGAFIHALLEGKDVAAAVSFGMEAATMSLQCAEHAISPDLGRMVDSI